MLKYTVVNKMNIENISICFAPCIFRLEKISLTDVININKSIIYCKIMLEEFDQIFGTSEEVENLYRNSYLKN
jgi:hypothetical protein